MLTRKSRLLLSLTAATPLFFAACKDYGPGNPYTDVAGTYQLTIFAGQTPPVTYRYPAGQDDLLPNGGTKTWTDGTIVLNSNGTFTERNNFDYTDDGGQSGSSAFTSSGTFTVTGTDFTLSAPRQNNIPARFATGTIVVDRINYFEDNGDGTTSPFEYRR